MAKTGREFTPEFKREAELLLESSGRPRMQITAEVGFHPSMLRQLRSALMVGSLPPCVAGSPGAAGRVPAASRHPPATTDRSGGLCVPQTLTADAPGSPSSRPMTASVTRQPRSRITTRA